LKHAEPAVEFGRVAAASMGAIRFGLGFAPSHETPDTAVEPLAGSR
jgi:hypothetical protein